MNTLFEKFFGEEWWIGAIIIAAMIVLFSLTGCMSLDQAEQDARMHMVADCAKMGRVFVETKTETLDSGNPFMTKYAVSGFCMEKKT